MFGLMLLPVFVLVDLPIFQPANPKHARMIRTRFGCTRAVKLTPRLPGEECANSML
jgi:hypothetical protein